MPQKRGLGLLLRAAVAKNLKHVTSQLRQSSVSVRQELEKAGRYREPRSW